MPFIVRQELGYQDRDQYKILDPLPAGQELEPLAPAEAVEPQAADHARRRLRRRPRRGQRAARRLQRHLPATPGNAHTTSTALGRGFAVGVDRAQQQRPQLQHRRPGRVDDDGEGAPDRALRRPPLHDRLRLLGRLDHPAAGRQRLPGRGLRRPRRHVRLPGQPLDRARSSPTTTCCASTSRTPRAGAPASSGRRPQWAEVEGQPDHVNAIAADELFFKSATEPQPATASRPRSSTTATRTPAACAARSSTT